MKKASEGGESKKAKVTDERYKQIRYPLKVSAIRTF